ncbi:MAG: ribonuclease HII [Nanoarchaeota archaeon]|nr:ribonuclease HII [Nanoarchaeota archaeon]
MVFVFGADEAGKGSLIGNLYLAGVLIEESKTEDLKSIGAKDSKLLTHKKRIELAKKIKTIVKNFLILEITPEEIDNAILGNNTLNLNWLEGDHIAELINKLSPDKAIIDCPSPNLNAFKNYVQKQLKNKTIELIVGHKMDTKEITVSAASILAKVAREENVKEIEKKVGQSIGSGYPSNPTCQEFLKKNFEKYPEIFRKSWKTYQNNINNNKQKILGDF